MNPFKKIRWALIISGYGRSASCLFDMIDNGTLSEGHEIVALVTDGQENAVEERCKDMGLEIFNKSAKTFDSIEIYQRTLIKQLRMLEIDYLFLPNYRYRIRNEMLEAYKNRIINVHPSLLPSFRNTAKAIHEALEYGVRVSGITTHIIDEEMDKGIILCQIPIKIGPQDNFETIYPKYKKQTPQIFEETFNLVAKHHQVKEYLQSLIN